jgi:hypothetical protein
MVKIVVLQSNPQFYLIGSVVELDEEPSLLIEKCYSVTYAHDSTHPIMEKYPKMCDQRDLFLTSESILTIVDPNKQLLDLYLEASKSEED